MPTSAYTEQQSETWLLERTYHAQLRNGRELSVVDLTLAMKQLINFSVPLSTWKEVSQEEAQASFYQGFPILLYGEHSWEHPQGAYEAWRPNRNMRVLIYGSASVPPEVVSGTEYAVCYLDPKRGTFSNDAWRAWFPSDTTVILAGNAQSPITFLIPCVQFPATIHYTMIEASGHVQEYADRAEAIEGFLLSPPRKVSNGNAVQTMVFPQFCYYHEVTCTDGVYRLEFFGPHMNEQGYLVKTTEENEKEMGSLIQV